MTVFLLPTASMASTKGLQTPVNAMSTRCALKGRSTSTVRKGHDPAVDFTFFLHPSDIVGA